MKKLLLCLAVGAMISLTGCESKTTTKPSPAPTGPRGGASDGGGAVGGGGAVTPTHPGGGGTTPMPTLPAAPSRTGPGTSR